MDHIIGQSRPGAQNEGVGAQASAPLVSDGSQATFMQDVIEASRTVPVLVDFWADWCGPCKQLAPVLEKVVTAAKGRLRLVKIDIEANRALTAQLAQVGLPLQSIPLVATFWKGQILDLFQGALPESEIKKFVENVLKAAGGGTMPATELLEQANVALETSRPEHAAELYSAVIGEEPENPKAWSGLIRAMLALDDEEAAAAALADVPAKIAEAPEVVGARAALELKKEGRKAAEEMEEVRARLAANPNDYDARCELATGLNAAGKREEAADELLAVIRADRNWKEGAARLQLLRFFEAWGHDDPATLAARRKLSSLLFFLISGPLASYFPDDEDIARAIPRVSDLTLADIPAEIGLFPLSGVLLLPRGKLPLNVFEPRYIALVEDALASHRLIGLIQPVWKEEDAETDDAPPLYHIGSIGRITSFTERSDGTYAITLSGIARFRLLRETGLHRGYRQARIDASSFASDLSELPSAPFDRQKLLDSMRRYFQQRGLGARWSAIEQMGDDVLLVTLPMICPFPPAEKQALLDAGTLTDRVRVLQMLLDLAGPEDEGPPS